METGEQQIIEILEKADSLFRELKDVPKEALSLWGEGIDRLSAALWIYEKKTEE